MIAFNLIAALALAGRLTNAGIVDEAYAYDLAHDAHEIAMEDEPLFNAPGITEDDARFRTMKLLVVWGGFESAGRCRAVGDGGSSIGAMQFREDWLKHASLAPFGARRVDVLGSCKLGLRMGLALMRDLRNTCGSVKGALNAYASGSCFGSLRGRVKVAERCALAGGC